MKPLLILCFTLFLLSPLWAQPEKAPPVSPWRWGVNLQAGNNYPKLQGQVAPYVSERMYLYQPRFEVSGVLGAEGFVERRLAARWYVRTGLAMQYLTIRGSAGSSQYDHFTMGVGIKWLTLSVPLEVHHLIPVGQRGYRLRLSTGVSGVWYPLGTYGLSNAVTAETETRLQISYRRERAPNLGMQAGLAWEVPLGSHFLSFGAKAHLAHFRPLRHSVRVYEVIQLPPTSQWDVMYADGATLQRDDWRVAPTTLSFELGFLF
jgi:hypothetical protein